VSNLPSTHSRLPRWLSYHRLAVTYTAGSPRVAAAASPECTMYSYSLDNQPAFTRKRVPNFHGISSRANRGYVMFRHSDVDHNPPGPLLHSFDSLIGPTVLVPGSIPLVPAHSPPPPTNQSDTVRGPIGHGVLTKSVPGTILALVYRRGDCGTTVGGYGGKSAGVYPSFPRVGCVFHRTVSGGFRAVEAITNVFVNGLSGWSFSPHSASCAVCRGATKIRSLTFPLPRWVGS